VKPLPPVIPILPPWAAQMLREASQTLNTRKDPRARLKAIELATEHTKRQYPRYFRKER